jgi:microcystin-dependent protein
MAEPFLGELRLMSFNFPPKGWAFCNGQLLPINQNQALVSLLGTTYGGNGQTTFALPDLRRRVPMLMGNGFIQGQQTGEEAHTLNVNEIPTHQHFMFGSETLADVPVPVNSVLGRANNMYAPPDSALTSMRPGSVTNVGGGQAHENRQPFLVLNWCIALQGIFPSRN